MGEGAGVDARGGGEGRGRGGRGPSGSDARESGALAARRERGVRRARGGDARACRGPGRAEGHGDFLLDALRPHLPSLRAAHAAAARGDIAPDIELVAAKPHGGGQAKVTAKAKSEMVVKQDDVSSDDDDAEEA